MSGGHPITTVNKRTSHYCSRPFGKWSVMIICVEICYIKQKQTSFTFRHNMFMIGQKPIYFLFLYLSTCLTMKTTTELNLTDTELGTASTTRPLAHPWRRRDIRDERTAVIHTKTSTGILTDKELWMTICSTVGRCRKEDLTARRQGCTVGKQKCLEIKRGCRTAIQGEIIIQAQSEASVPGQCCRINIWAYIELA